MLDYLPNQTSIFNNLCKFSHIKLFHICKLDIIYSTELRSYVNITNEDSDDSTYTKTVLRVLI